MINFPPTFDINSLYGTTTIKCAQVILENTITNAVPAAELVKNVVTYSNASSAESVRGTLDGGGMTPPKHKLRGQPFFVKSWVTCTSPKTGKRLIYVRQNSKELKAYNIVVPTYDTPNKQLARENGCLWCLREIIKDICRPPKILTLAGPLALCAQGMYKISPDADITNIDTNEAVLEESAKLKLDMKNILIDITKFIKRMIGKNTGVLVYDRDDFLDLMNYDTDGYYGKKLDSNLKIINDRVLCNYLCLTIQSVKTLRNSGDFKKKFEDRYAGYEDPTLQALVDTMSKYDLVNHFEYKRSDDSPAVMRTFIFKLK